MKSTLNKIGQWFATLRWRYVITWFTLIVLLITVVYPTWMGWVSYKKSMGPPHALSVFKYTDYRKIETDKTTFAEVKTLLGEPRILDDDVNGKISQIQAAGDQYVGALTLYRWKDRHARIEIRIDERGLVRWAEYAWFEE